MAFISLSCAAAVLFASAVPTTSHRPTTNSLPLTQAFSHAQSVSSAHLVPTQEGRRQMKEDCQFADGTPGTKCDGVDACAGIDSARVECGSCNDVMACTFSLTAYNSLVFVKENSCNGVMACSGHIQGYGVQSGTYVVIGKGSW